MKMFCDLEDICELLREFGPKFKHVQPIRADLKDVAFVSESVGFERTDRLYIADEETIQRLRHTGKVLDVLCFCENQAEAEGLNHNMIWINIRDNREEIIKKIQDCFEIQSEVREASLRLMEATYSQQGLKHLIGVGLEILGNPFFICDVSYKVLGYTDCEIDENRLPWEHITKDEVHYDFVVRLKNDGTFEKLYTYGIPQMRTESNGSRTMGMRLSVKNKAVGHMVLYEYFKPFTEKDKLLIMLFTQAVADELQKEAYYLSDQSSISEVVMLELLERKIDKDAARIRLLNYDLGNKNDLHLLVAGPAKGAVNSASLHYIKRILSELIAGSIAIVFKEMIVLLIADSTYLSDEQTQAAVEKILSENHFTAGISYAFCDISELRTHYEQACHIVKIAARMDEPFKAFYYEDYCLYDLFYSVESSKELMDFCNPKIMDLMEYDKKHNTTYVHSVYAYLKLNKDLNKCAEALCLHRNSIDYRIKKIQEILGMDFGNEEFCFSCFLSLKILAFKGLYRFYY